MSRRKESHFSGKFNRDVFIALGYAYRPYKYWMIFFSALGVVGRLLLLANANVIGYWVDSLCSSAPCKAPPVFFVGYQSSDYILLLSLLVGVGFLLTWIFRVGFSDVSALAVSTLYDETSLRVSRFPMTFFDQTPVGRVITRFSSDYGNVFRLFGGPLAEFCSLIFDLFWMIVLTSIASPRFLPLLAVTTLLQYVLYKCNQQNLRTCRRDLSASRSPSVAHFSETAQGAWAIRSFGKEKSFSDRFQELDQQYLTQKNKTVKTIVLFALQMNFTTALLLVLAGTLALFGLQSQNLSAGSLGVAFGFIALSGNTVQMFFEWLAQFEEAIVGVERLNQYLRSDLEPHALLPASAQFPTDHPVESLEQKSPDVVRHNASIQFRHVSFRYQPDLPWVFQDLDFEIKAGEKFGIIGRTGSGKSSLIQTLFHLYPLNTGNVLVGGRSPLTTKVPLREYRQLIALISQDPTLFKASLRDNLDQQKKFSDTQVIESLKQVGLPDWATLQGLEKVIEEKGRNLSVGEKQLLCLARAILQNCPVVILDEATSAIDPRSEEILVKATENFFKGRTQILIAHRLSTLLSCDRVLWLQDGKIQKIGTPSEVLPEFEKTNLSFASPSGILAP